MRLLDRFLIVERVSARAPLVHRLAIGIASRIAADMGAKVIKIVSPAGDPLSNTPVIPHESPETALALSAVIDASKTVVKLDDEDPHCALVLKDLLRQARGLITDEHQIDTPTGNPRVDVAVKVLPSDDLLAKNSPSELTVLALSGMLDLIGDPENSPLALGGHQVAYASGYTAFTALMGGLASLRNRQLAVDVLDVMMWINWKGGATSAFRPGSNITREGARAEWQVVACADGHIALVHSEKDWKPLAELIGHPDLMEPDMFTLLGREKKRDHYLPIIRAWAKHRTRDEIYRSAQAKGVPIGPVFAPSELLNDAQLKARDVIAQFEYQGKMINLPRLPIRWDGAAFNPVAPRYVATLKEALL